MRKRFEKKKKKEELDDDLKIIILKILDAGAFVALSVLLICLHLWPAGVGSPLLVD